jgi:hypothetical protein
VVRSETGRFRMNRSGQAGRHGGEVQGGNVRDKRTEAAADGQSTASTLWSFSDAGLGPQGLGSAATGAGWRFSRAPAVSGAEIRTMRPGGASSRGVRFRVPPGHDRVGSRSSAPGASFIFSNQLVSISVCQPDLS